MELERRGRGEHEPPMTEHAAVVAEEQLGSGVWYRRGG